MIFALPLHGIAAAIWVGGMFFAYMALRPAAGALEPPQRLKLWRGTFDKFFPWVWAAVASLLITGYAMIFLHFGGFAGAGLHVHIMHGIGLIMMALFAHLFFAPWKRLKLAVDTGDWVAGGRNLGQIRKIVGINLILGLITVAVGSGGRYWP
ncbi:membrane protein [Skermanella stibiiresistens SB22]|uniref:Membrane protein n=1 Tax=Skermanella stibiiresistens SB22 TaxID=1385369 RepID=W9GW67_9PROT|nr:CopD family protein [Skermanella stibiiresistens]EWY38064.1 membrane protein [Skermanella stibiiresistens SB22]